MKQYLVMAGLLILGTFPASCGQRGPLAEGVTPTTLNSISPVSSITPTASQEASITPSPAPSPLSTAILTLDEVFIQYPTLEGYFGDATDVTDEFQSNNDCIMECVKYIWSTGIYGPRQLTITMIKNTSSEMAQKLVEDTRSGLTDIDDLSDQSSLAYLPENTWAVYSHFQNEFLLAYSYGQVFVLLVSQPDYGFDDFAGEFDLISLIGHLQMEKLNSSGYVP